MPHLAQGGIQLGLEIGGRAGGFPPPPPPPPRRGGGEAVFRRKNGEGGGGGGGGDVGGGAPFSSRRRHTRCLSDWSSDVCSSDLDRRAGRALPPPPPSPQRRQGQSVVSRHTGGWRRSPTLLRPLPRTCGWPDREGHR